MFYDGKRWCWHRFRIARDFTTTNASFRIGRKDVMFNIENSADYYAMLVADFDDFMEDQRSARKAIHCAITSYHLGEWVWHDWLKNQGGVKGQLGITNEKSFYKYLNDHFWLNLLREIANGSKHFKKQAIRTQLVDGYGAGTYGIGPYGTGYLMIDLGSAIEPTEDSFTGLFDPDEELSEPDGTNYIGAVELLEIAVRFWRDFFRQYRPDIQVQPSSHHTV